jgi:hypothetical protein
LHNFYANADTDLLALLIRFAKGRIDKEKKKWYTGKKRGDKMKVIVCIDDGLGMMFNKRRQSRDRAVIADILSYAEGRLTVAPAAARLFPEGSVTVAEEPLDAVEGYAFIERGGIGRVLSRVSEIIIYRWNELYPMDERLDIDPIGEGFSTESVTDFAGYAHEKITKEVYRR